MQYQLDWENPQKKLPKDKPFKIFFLPIFLVGALKYNVLTFFYTYPTTHEQCFGALLGSSGAPPNNGKGND